MGQYPYQSTKSRRIHMFCLVGSLLTLVVPQVIAEGDVDLMITCLPPLLTNGGCFVKLFNLQIHKDMLRILFDLIREEWAGLKNEEEIRVVSRVTADGKKYGAMYRRCLWWVSAMYLTMPLAPIFLDVILPKNESRPHLSLYEVDYFFDTSDHFYYTYIHLAMASLCSTIILATNDALYMLICHHACGLFDLCGCRIGNLINNIEEDIKDKCTERREKILHSQLRECIITHKKAIQFVDILATGSSTSYFIQIGMNMIIISITGVQAVIKLHEVGEAARCAMFAIAQGVHLFYNSYPGQKILDHSEELDKVIYSTEWYKVPLKMQKMLLAMQLRCKWPCRLSAGGLYDMNMENFGMIVKTSMSYFTMFLSIRE